MPGQRRFKDDKLAMERFWLTALAKQQKKKLRQNPEKPEEEEESKDMGNAQKEDSDSDTSGY